jgi:hypothetical protein
MIILLTWHYYYLLKPIINTAEKKGQSVSSTIQIPRDLELEKENKLLPTLAGLDFISYSKILCYRIQRFILSLLGILPGMYIN